jgi:hypothetical protein
VRLDLRRVGVELEPETGDHLRGEPLPVDVGIGGDVRVVVADRAVRLALERHALDRRDLPLEARVDVGHLLAERRRCRRLAMRAREHRQRGVRVRERLERRRDVAQRRQQDRPSRLGERDAVREVVDVLGRAREMDELGDARDLFDGRESFPQPVFDGLDVVVGRALDRLDALGVDGGERRRRCIESGASIRAERRDFGDRRLLGERDEPRDLDAHARAISPNSLKCSASGATFFA